MGTFEQGRKDQQQRPGQGFGGQNQDQQRPGQGHGNQGGQKASGFDRDNQGQGQGKDPRKEQGGYKEGQR